MKDKLKKTLAAAKAYLQRAKLIFTRIETTVHAAVIAGVGGGVATVYEQVHATGHVAMTAEQFLALKAHFYSGAVIALLAWLKQAPALKQPTSPQP